MGMVGSRCCVVAVVARLIRLQDGPARTGPAARPARSRRLRRGRARARRGTRAAVSHHPGAAPPTWKPGPSSATARASCHACSTGDTAFVLRDVADHRPWGSRPEIPDDLRWALVSTRTKMGNKSKWTAEAAEAVEAAEVHDSEARGDPEGGRRSGVVEAARRWPWDALAGGSQNTRFARAAAS